MKKFLAVLGISLASLAFAGDYQDKTPQEEQEVCQDDIDHEETEKESDSQ